MSFFVYVCGWPILGGSYISRFEGCRLYWGLIYLGVGNLFWSTEISSRDSPRSPIQDGALVNPFEISVSASGRVDERNLWKERFRLYIYAVPA